MADTPLFERGADNDILCLDDHSTEQIFNYTQQRCRPQWDVRERGRITRGRERGG